MDRAGGNLHLEIKDLGLQSGKEDSPKVMDQCEIMGSRKSLFSDGIQKVRFGDGMG